VVSFTPRKDTGKEAGGGPKPGLGVMEKRRKVLPKAVQPVKRGKMILSDNYLYPPRKFLVLISVRV
jgi:hypothetical protein